MTRAEELFRRVQQQGMAALDALIADVVAEEMFLDFKRSSENRIGRSINEGDAKILSKAISGFGNADGGLIVWGVDRRSNNDGAQQIGRFPLSDAAVFRANIESAISRLTIPVHPGIQNIELVGDQAPSGYVVTYIPRASFSPIRAVAKGTDRYYIRAGDSFVSTPHGVLEAQFGRRPLGVAWVQLYAMDVGIQAGSESISIAFGVGCANGGVTLLEHAYLSVHPGNLLTSSLLRLTSGSNGVEAHSSITGNWQAHVPTGRVIAPGGVQDLAIVSFALQPKFNDFSDSLVIEIVMGASHTAPRRFTVECSRDALAEAVTRLRATRTQFSSGDLFSLVELTNRLRLESFGVP